MHALHRAGLGWSVPRSLPGVLTAGELAGAVEGTVGRYSPYAVYLSGGGDPAQLAAVRDGQALVQDEGSQLVARALTLAPVADDTGRWLDLCAGPGGKTALLAALALGRSATVVANEAGNAVVMTARQRDIHRFAEIIAALDESKIPYQIRGGSIYVPNDKVYQVRMQMAGKGIPRGEGVGFEIFDKANFGISDFVQRANYPRAVQGELARRGMVFNQTDTEKFRATLRGAGFYADWKQKYGPQAWAALEQQVGSLS